MILKEKGVVVWELALKEHVSKPGWFSVSLI